MLQLEVLEVQAACNMNTRREKHKPNRFVRALVWLAELVCNQPVRQVVHLTLKVPSLDGASLKIGCWLLARPASTRGTLLSFGKES